MKFYRGMVNVGKSPVVTQIQRGFKPMTYNKDKQPVQIANAKPVNPMSAAEVVVLRYLHGQDSVTELYEVGQKRQLSFAAERDRLETDYGDKVIAAVFGVRGVGTRLPREVENVEPEPEAAPINVAAVSDELDSDEMDDEPEIDAAASADTAHAAA